jgi:tetratricopeptide (TPR) repeat protein
MDSAEKAYLRALENHKTQPIFNPRSLWLCYDGLGMVYGLSKRYEPSKTYFQKGYQHAMNMEDDRYLARSAYNLACVHAEAGDLQSCMTHLAEAIKLDPARKKQAQTDSSFAGVKDEAEFKKLMED